MLTPYKWLKDYVKIENPAKEFKDNMVNAGNAVESMTEQGSDVKNVVVGKIERIVKHPDADKLLVCDVNTGAETIQIVTGADNVFEGAMVPVALDGSVLPNGMKIKKGKLRGVESLGMLCSGEELKLAESDYEGAGIHGILILKEDYAPGTDIKDVFGWNDTIFEFEVGANRPDCLSIVGLAREAAAVFGKELILPDTSFKESGGSISDYVAVEVKDEKLCPRYMARAIRNVKIGLSPKWMQERLRSAGVRPISNIVDITNFVMLETGQPMHAFDLNDIKGKKIIVRRAYRDEKMTTLDGKERGLAESMLMICDSERTIGIAGIMGGENSEIKDTTSTVIFEAAKFTYGNIRQTSRALGLFTESAMRFSKGVDTANVKTAMERALNLVTQLNAGEIVSGEIDVLSEDLSPRTVQTDASKINGLLGTDIAIGEMASILNRLQIETAHDGKTLSCKIPGFRGDIEGSADIAEEVARLYGYGNIPVKKIRGDITRGRVSQGEAMRDRLKTMLMGAGLYECVTYSFGAQSVFDRLLIAADDPIRNTIRLVNPLGDDKSVMRTLPAGDMLAAVSTNLNRKVGHIRLFEAGKVYIPKSLPVTDLPDEKPYLCIALCGAGEDFYTLKGVVENILWRLNAAKVEFTAGGRSYYHPGRKAQVYASGVLLGGIGEIHPDAAANFDISERVYMAEIMLEPLKTVTDDVRKYRALPRFPEMERDLAFAVDANVTAGELQKLIEKKGGQYLKSVALFDVYTGEKLGAGKKSLAYSLVFRAEDRTLNDAETGAAVDKIVEAARNAFGAELRS